MGSGMCMHPLCVHMQVCVQPAAVCVGPRVCPHVSWWGGVCIYMCFSVFVHEHMCVHDMHSFLCVRVHACGYVLLMYTQLSALSMSHALCSGSPLS